MEERGKQIVKSSAKSRQITATLLAWAMAFVVDGNGHGSAAPSVEMSKTSRGSIHPAETRLAVLPASGPV